VERKPFGVIQRRRFLQLAGGATGIAALRPMLSAQEALASSSLVKLKVGALVPSGAKYPGLAENFLDGIRLHFDEARTFRTPIDASVQVESVAAGFGGAEEAATRLIDQAKVDVIVADVTAPVAARLGQMARDRKVPFVVANVGGHVGRAAERNPYLLTNSLNYWQSSFATGSWAAANIGRRAVVAASLPDSGYDTVYAFRQGFAAGGGSVVGSPIVTHAGPGTAGISEVLAAARAAGADFIYGLYSGAAAVEAVKTWSGSDLRGRIPLAGAGFMVEDYVLGQEGSAAQGVRSALSWSSALDTDANRAFQQAYRTRTGRDADPFAVLGYDTGRLVTTGVRLARRSGAGTSRLVDALAGVSVASPRGKLTVDAQTNQVRGPQYIREVQGSGGSYRNAVIARAPAVAGSLSGLDTELASGFLNECLCA
jgi:branched-chain amino acid transport system substrate-binding protein